MIDFSRKKPIRTLPRLSPAVSKKRILTASLIVSIIIGIFWTQSRYPALGEKAAMACTAAVEEVIDDHYESQRQQLKHWGVEKKFEQTIAKFQADEVEHRDTAYDHGAKDTPGYKFLSETIKAGCRSAIWLSKRV